MPPTASLRGLAIEGFGVGVASPIPTDVGDLIQGNFIGEYLPIRSIPTTGIASAGPEHCRAGRPRATRSKGSCSTRLNATVGGTDPQDSNVIGGNGAKAS